MTLRNGVCFNKTITKNQEFTLCQLCHDWWHRGCYVADTPDSKIHGANMGPIWGRQDPGGPHVGPMNFAISRWAIGGRWLQSPASQDDDGGKPDFGEGHFWPCYRDWIVAILACEQVLDIANPLYSNGRSSRDSLASQGARIFQREAGDSIERGGWLTTKYV